MNIDGAERYGKVASAIFAWIHLAAAQAEKKVSFEGLREYAEAEKRLPALRKREDILKRRCQGFTARR